MDTATRPMKKISIHALREEGDALPMCKHSLMIDFYPRPP